MYIFFSCIKGANVYVRDRGVDNPEGPLNMRSKSRPASAWSCSSHSMISELMPQ